MHTFCKLPPLWVFYFWQCARKARHQNNTPLSGISNHCFRSSTSSLITTLQILTSYSWTTFGCLTFFRIVISLFILSRSAWSLIFSFSRILIATCEFLQVKHFRGNLPFLQLDHACLIWLYQRYLYLLSYLRKNARLEILNSLVFEFHLPTEKFPICLCSSFFFSSSGVFVPLLSSFTSTDLVSFCGFCYAAGAGLYSPEGLVFIFVFDD